MNVINNHNVLAEIFDQVTLNRYTIQLVMYIICKNRKGSLIHKCLVSHINVML